MILAVGLGFGRGSCDVSVFQVLLLSHMLLQRMDSIELWAYPGSRYLSLRPGYGVPLLALRSCLEPLRSSEQFCWSSHARSVGG